MQTIIQFKNTIQLDYDNIVQFDNGFTKYCLIKLKDNEFLYEIVDRKIIVGKTEIYCEKRFITLNQFDILIDKIPELVHCGFISKTSFANGYWLV